MTASALVARLRRRRTIVLLALLVLLIAFRIALPRIVRDVAESQADAALVGRITLEDVDLSLIRGGITLHGLEVYADELPASVSPDPAAGAAGAPSAPSASSAPAPGASSPPSASSAGAPGAAGAGASAKSHTPTGDPLAKIGTLEVRIGWLPLFRKRVEVEEIRLDDFVVRLDRAQDGALVLPRPVPSEAPAEPEPPEEGPGWGVLVSSVRLTNGLVGFRDYAVDPEPKPLELAIEDVTANNLYLTLGTEEEQPGHLALQAKIGEGSLALDSQIAMLAAGPRVDSKIELHDLPIQGTRLYLKTLGWSEVAGALDAELAYLFESGGAQTASGTLTLRDLAITVPQLEGPGLSWKRLDVALKDVDVTGRRAEVASVVLDGLRVPVRPNEPGKPFPLLQQMLAGEETAEKKSPEMARAETPPPKPAKAETPQAGAAPNEPPPAESAPAETAGAEPARATAASETAEVESTPAAAPTREAPSGEAAPVETEQTGSAPVEARTAKTAPDDTAVAEQPQAQSGAAKEQTGQAPSGDGAPTEAPQPPPPSRPSHPPVQKSDDGAWAWRVNEARITNATLDVLREGQPTPIGLSAEAKPLSSDPSATTNVSLTLTPPEGTLGIAGNLVQQPLAFDGKLSIGALSLPKLLAPIDQPAAALLRGGVLDTDLAVAVGLPSGAGEQAARVSGTIALADVAIAEPEPASQEFGIAWKSLALDVGELVVPAALGGAATDPIRATLDSVKLVEPDVRVTRTADGIVLPAALGGKTSAPPAAATAPDAPQKASAPASPPAALAEPKATQTAPATAAATEPEGAATEPSPSPIDVRVTQATIERGRIQVEDRTVKPTYRNEINSLDLRASGIHWPGPTIDKLRLDAESKGDAKLTVEAKMRGGTTEVKAKLDRLPLAPLNPYAAGSGYGLGGGAASLESTFSMKGADYDASSHLVLSQFALTGDQGDALFQQQFGVPLSLALALLTDLQGDISLDIPVRGDRSGASVDLASIISQALTKAILGAITSPLKLIMAVGTSGGKVEAGTPQAVQFRPGRAQLARGGEDLLDRLAELLGRSPGLTIGLQGRAGAEDERWLREQALRAQIEDSSGFMGKILNVGELGEREIVMPVLESRAHDEPAEIPPEAKDWFEARVAEQVVTPAQIAELAAARAELVRKNLVDEHGIASDRIQITPADTSASQPPEVGLSLGTMSGGAAAGEPASGAASPPSP